MLGTRPEIIKMSPIIREYERRGLDFFVIHTGQHYSYELDEAFFRYARALCSIVLAEEHPLSCLHKQFRWFEEKEKLR